MKPILSNDPDNMAIYFFYSETCSHCQDEMVFLKQMELKYPNITINKLNVKDEENLKLWRRIANAYDVYGLELPMTFIGNNVIIGYDDDKTSGDVIEQFIIKGLENDYPDPIEIMELSTIGDISIIQLMSLAIVDAINPCEIAILIFLMTTMLTRFPKDKNKAIKAGLMLISGIAISYFFFGVLIIFGYKFILNVSNIFQTWIYNLLALFSIVLGLLNIKDAFWYGSWGFILEIPMKWRPKLKKIIEGTTSVNSAFLLGIIVSFFLTPCTAGPYFVAGGILSEMNIIKAIPFLIFYLGIFISPMVLILLIIYFGFKTIDDIYGWREKNIKKLHFYAGVILVGLGLSMIFGLI
jgi:cytochrome c biogenesis protein CcdA